MEISCRKIKTKIFLSLFSRFITRIIRFIDVSLVSLLYIIILFKPYRLLPIPKRPSMAFHIALSCCSCFLSVFTFLPGRPRRGPESLILFSLQKLIFTLLRYSLSARTASEYPQYGMFLLSIPFYPLVQSLEN